MMHWSITLHKQANTQAIEAIKLLQPEIIRLQCRPTPYPPTTFIPYSFFVCLVTPLFSIPYSSLVRGCMIGIFNSPPTAISPFERLTEHFSRILLVKNLSCWLMRLDHGSYVGPDVGGTESSLVGGAEA